WYIAIINDREYFVVCMKKKLAILFIFLCGSLFGYIALKLNNERIVARADYYAQMRTLELVHRMLIHEGPEKTQTFIESGVIGCSEAIERLLESPLAPWWPHETRRSVVKMRMSRSEELEVIRKHRKEFSEKLRNH
ncbi:MAG: hypothetical protein AAF423_14250, partial [Pseudomonadota bacterium]